MEEEGKWCVVYLGIAAAYPVQRIQLCRYITRLFYLHLTYDGAKFKINIAEKMIVV